MIYLRNITDVNIYTEIQYDINKEKKNVKIENVNATQILNNNEKDGCIEFHLFTNYVTCSLNIHDFVQLNIIDFPISFQVNSLFFKIIRISTCTN